MYSGGASRLGDSISEAMIGSGSLCARCVLRGDEGRGGDDMHGDRRRNEDRAPAERATPSLRPSAANP